MLQDVGIGVQRRVYTCRCAKKGIYAQVCKEGYIRIGVQRRVYTRI
jgi:hypothetical protein